MRRPERKSTDSSDEILDAFASWKRRLRAENKLSESYENGILNRVMLGLFVPFLEANGYPTTVDDVTEDHVVDFLAMLREDRPTTGRPYSDSSVALYDRALRAFFNWCAHTDRIEVSPFRRIKVPAVTKNQNRDAHTDEEVRAMLATCSGRNFLDLRDNALIRMFYDCGHRLEVIASLEEDQIDLDACDFKNVIVKGGDEHYGRFTPETAVALDDYLRERRKHRYARRRELWIGQNGPMTGNGIRQAIKKRARKAGLDTMPHRFRHTWNHVMRTAGAPEEVIQELGAWRSRSMVAYYGSSHRKMRAEDWYRKNAPGRNL